MRVIVPGRANASNVARKRPYNLMGEIRGYESSANRERAVKQLRRVGYNYFVRFVDVQSRYALQVSVCACDSGTRYGVR